VRVAEGEIHLFSIAVPALTGVSGC
jgi:hypothetical protein